MTTPSMTQEAREHPSGHAGFDRAWDGEAWVGPAIPAADAPELHAPRSLRAMLWRAPFWCALLGMTVGTTLAVAATADEGRITWLMLIGGFIATGGPILALVLGVRRRLRIDTLDALAVRNATLVGLASGVAALGVALVLEKLAGTLVGAEEGKPNEGLLLLAGPIEEGAKLLVPVILLGAGVAFLRSPRLGVWAVLLSASVFGAAEGALYASNLGGARDNQPAENITKDFPGVSDQAADSLAELMSVVPRIWVEIGHPLWTTGAAVIIWLSAHSGRRVLAWATLGAYLGAAAIHSFNDGVLSLFSGALPILGSIIWISLSYVFWFRPMVRRLVPPDALADVPARWTPPLPKDRAAA